MIQMNLYAKKKQTYRHRQQAYGYQRGKGGPERDKSGVWNLCIYTTMPYRTDNQQGPTVA